MMCALGPCDAAGQSRTLQVSATMEVAAVMTVGEVIATGRKRAGLTLKEVAAQVRKEDGIPVSLTYLNDVEHDRRPAPAPHLLRQLADVLHLSYEYLLFLSRDLPEDLYDETATPDAVEAAFQAFRRTLKEQSERGG